MEQKLKFNEWMQKIKNLYYSDNDAMIRAYDRIIEF